MRFAEWYYGPQERLFAAYDLKVLSTNKIFDVMHGIANYQNIQESRHDRRFNNYAINHRMESVNVRGLNLDFRKQISNNELRYGAEAYFNDVASNANSEAISTGITEPLDTRYPDGGSTMNSYSVFITHSIELASRKLILSDGLRFSYSTLNAIFNDTTFFPFPFTSIKQNSGALTGSLGLIYMPGSFWRFSLLGSTGYRTPNVDDLAKVFDSEPGSVVVPNPELKSEYTYNVDLNISKIIADHVRIEAVGFYTLFNNAQTIEPALFNGEDSIIYSGELSEVKMPVNAVSAYLYGLTGRIEAELTNMISLTSTLTYTYGRIETDTTPYPLDHIPPLYGKTSVNVQAKKFRGEFYALYNGWKHIEDYNIIGGEDNEQYATEDGMPSWYTLNIKASYSINDMFHVQAGVENITDYHYRVSASGISAPGRSIYLTLRARF